MAIPSLQDVSKPFDPTGYASLSPSQLAQLVDGITPYTDKGLVITTSDADTGPQPPDAISNPKWQNYLWRRLAFDNNVYLYFWNPNVTADNSLSKWRSVFLNVPINVVGTDQLQDGSVTDAKIVSVDYSKIANYPSVAGGDLFGNYPNPSINAKAVTTGKINDNAITHTQLAANAVQVTTDILKSATPLQVVRTNAAGTAVEWGTLSKLTQTDVVSTSAGNLGKIPQVATVGAADTGTWAMKSFAELNPLFTSTLIDIASNGTSAQAHGFYPNIPSFVRAVMVCTDVGGNQGYVQNQEVGLEYFYNGIACPIASVSAGATNVAVRFSSDASFKVANWGDGTNVAITAAKWKLKIYARL